MSGKSKGIRTALAMSRVDTMSPDRRALVHEFGESIVNVCLQCGVREGAIRRLVYGVWHGARAPRQASHTAVDTLDWLLVQAGSQVSARALVGVLEASSLFIVPRNPTVAMVNASLAEVSGFNVVCTKREKHRLRLAAAIAAGSRHLFRDPNASLSALTRSSTP